MSIEFLEVGSFTNIQLATKQNREYNEWKEQLDIKIRELKQKHKTQINNWWSKTKMKQNSN